VEDARIVVVQVTKGRGELARQFPHIGFLVIASLVLDGVCQGSGIGELHDDADVVVAPSHNLVAFDDVIMLNSG
jgi:hypothetical protein